MAQSGIVLAQSGIVWANSGAVSSPNDAALCHVDLGLIQLHQKPSALALRPAVAKKCFPAVG
jgi:hypothetical protein